MRPLRARPHRPWFGVALCATMVLLLTMCSDSGPTSPGDPALAEGLSFTIVSGDEQKWIAGFELPSPLVVQVTDNKGRPVKDLLVNFRVIRGGGNVFAGSAQTDEQGTAQEYWALGIEPGENVLEVRAVNPTTGEKEVFAQFTATGFPGAEDLTVLSALFSHQWVLALVDRIQDNYQGVGQALKANLQRIVDVLHPGGVLAEVEEALTELEDILGEPRDFNPVEIAFLSHVTRFCRNRFDEVMQSISAM